MEISKDILEGCKCADRRSQFKLYEQCYPYLMSIALRYKKDSDEAASVLNIAFLKILNNLNTVDNTLSFKAWIRKILVHTLIDEYRKNRKHEVGRQNIDYEKEMGANGIHVDYNSAEVNLGVDQLLKFIHELNPLTASVFNMYVLDAYSHREIATMLAISESASKWHLFTARKQLQEKVQQAESTNITIHSSVKISVYEK